MTQALPGPMPTTGRWGWYQDHEGAEFRRVSELVKKVETDRYSLDAWDRRQVAEGLAVRDDLVLSIKAMGRPRDPVEGWSFSDKKKLNGIVKDAQAAAKQRDGGRAGTAVHDLTERVDRGEPIDEVTRGLPAGAAHDLRAYAKMRELNAWRSVEIERTVRCEELEVAGTFDRVDLVPGLAALLGPGDCQYRCASMGVDHDPDEATGLLPELPVIVDVKTEKDPTLNGLHIGPQLATYSRAKKMFRPTGGYRTVAAKDGTEISLPNGEYIPAPCVRQDVAIVVHVRDGDSVPLFVNLIEGWEAAVAAYEQMNREGRAKRKLGAAGAWFVPVPNVNRPRVAEIMTEHAVAAQYANPNRPAAVAEQAYGQDLRVPMTPVAPGDIGVSIAYPNGASETAVRGPDGLVRWEGSATVPVGGPGPGDGELQRQLIAAIWQTRTVDGLAILWNMAQDRGVPWRGPVEQAGTARRRQMECPQRALHTGQGARCACGWTSDVPA